MSIQSLLNTCAVGGERSDPYFTYNTLLLNGSGTNGSQNKTFTDASANGYTLTGNDTTHQSSFSPYGDSWSNYFDGTGDQLVAANNSLFAFGTGDFTVECWLYATGSNSSVANFSNGQSSNSNFGWELFLADSTTIFFSIIDGSTQYSATSTNFSLNAWNHVAGVRNGNTMTVYVNGVAGGTTATVTGVNSNSPSGATVKVSGYNNGNNVFVGYIGDFRITKGSALYTAAFTPPTAPLTAVSGTSLLTCQSNRFKDSSTNNFAITASGNVKVSNFSPFAPTQSYSAETFGGSAYFDGGYDYITYPTNIAMPTTGDFTVEGWFQPHAGDRMAVILWGDGYSAGNAALYIYFAGTTGITVYTNSTNQTLAVTGVVQFGEWVHVAVTRSSNTGTLWVNGVSQGTFTFSTLNNTGTFQRLGTSYYGPYGEQAMYAGYMSDVRYSNVARYSSTFTPPTAPVTNDASTVMLLNMAKGDMHDVRRAHQFEAVGTAQISTSVKKYGTGSISLPAGTLLGSYLRVRDVAYSTAAGPFTYECWFYSLDNSKYHSIWSTPQSGYNSLYGLFTVNPTMGISMVWGGGGGIYSAGGYGTGTLPTVNTWTHLAVTRDASNTWRFFVDGVLTSHTRTAMIYFTGSDVGPSVDLVVPAIGCSIGGMEAGQNAESLGTSKCHIDDLRITIGVARYTENFTPPALKLPAK